MDILNTFNNFGDVYGSPPERTLFLHANNYTVKDLIGYSTSLSGFWRDYVLPISHMVNPVRHALISLGASHKSFLLRRTPGMPYTETQSYDNLAIQQYNKAISDLTPIMGNPSPLDVQAILICCLIFVCIDNLNGRHNVALRHLRAGADLLNSMLNPRSASTSTISDGEITSPGSVTSSKYDENGLDGISNMFERLTLDTSTLMWDPPVHRHKLFRFLPVGPAIDDKRPFLSSSAARDELRSIDVEFQTLCNSEKFEELCSQYCQNSPLGCGKPCTQEMQPYIPEFRDICDRFDRWCTRFDQYLESINHTPASDGEFNEAMVLTLHRKVWAAMLKSGPCCEAALPREYYADILHQAEIVIPAVSRGGRQPVFTFEADTIPPVSFVASFCEDDDLRSRAIAMLRMINRTEGAWDSQRMADMCEMELATGMCAGEISPSGLMDCQGLCANPCSNTCAPSVSRNMPVHFKSLDP
jgi:hypothetical protein